MRAFEIPFEERVIPLRRAESKQLINEYSPSGRVPTLATDDFAIWESLAIIEYLAETFPEHAIWPKGLAARTLARVVSSEMHGGFTPLRRTCPMDMCARYRCPEMTDVLARDVKRIEDIWADCKKRFGEDGQFLFGDFTAADAMFAPVVSRFTSYQIPVRDESYAYIQSVVAHPSYIEWRKAALHETWTIDGYAEGHELVEELTQ